MTSSLLKLFTQLLYQSHNRASRIEKYSTYGWTAVYIRSGVIWYDQLCLLKVISQRTRVFAKLTEFIIKEMTWLIARLLGINFCNLVYWPFLPHGKFSSKYLF